MPDTFTAKAMHRQICLQERKCNPSPKIPPNRMPGEHYKENEYEAVRLMHDNALTED